MSALTDYFTSLANKVRSKLGTNIQYTPAECVSAIDDVYTAGRNSVQTQTKTAPATPKASAQTISPDSGKLLSSVTIPAAFGGNPETYFGTNGSYTTTAGTSTRIFTLTCEINSWYFFAMANGSHIMNIASVSKASNVKRINTSVTSASDGTVTTTTHGIIFKATDTSVIVGISGIPKSGVSNVVPAFFKICGS